MRFFHGGAPGFKVGDYITPQGKHHGRLEIDGCELCEAGVDDSHAPDKVFVTENREYARFYASRYGRGDLYVVQPQGVMEPSDNDCDIPTWSCDRARIVSVYERHIDLTRSQRWRVFRLMSPAGEHIQTTRQNFHRMELQAKALAAATRLKQLRDKSEQEQKELDAAIAEQQQRIDNVK